MGQDIPTPYPAVPPADWRELHLTLDRCYKGPPAGRYGTFQGTVLTIYQMVKGTLLVRKDSTTITTRAGDGKWTACIPGERFQDFSEDAELISIHLSIREPGNGAEWRGLPLITFTPDAPAVTAMKRLMRAPALSRMTLEGTLNFHLARISMDHALGVQERSLAFFRQLLRLLAAHGMHYEAPVINDTRVRRSHGRLVVQEIRQTFSRAELAAAEGLTPGQLDRLWRQELGFTPHQYWDRRRHFYACEQLRKPGASVKEVASDLGFCHLSQFSNWFTARQGESPNQYRLRPQSS